VIKDVKMMVQLVVNAITSVVHHLMEEERNGDEDHKEAILTKASSVFFFSQ
jgi:hypothetical protein